MFQNVDLTSSVCVLVKQFGNGWPGELDSGFDTAVTVNGDIAVTDRHCAQVKMYGQDGTFKYGIDTSPGLSDELMRAKPGKKSYPKGIVINPVSGDILVTDGYYVKAFKSSEDGTFKYKFPALSPEGIASSKGDSMLSGLTLDVNTRLLVGEVRHRYISKHNLDGRHITTIKVRIQPQFIAVTPKNKIIISAWSLNSAIHILDCSGKLLHELKPPPEMARLWFPGGLCFSEGTIFVSNIVGIFCFSVIGEYLGCATKEVRCPLGLNVMHNGEKLVAVDGTGNSVKVFNLRY